MRQSTIRFGLFVSLLCLSLLAGSAAATESMDRQHPSPAQLEKTLDHLVKSPRARATRPQQRKQLEDMTKRTLVQYRKAYAQKS